MKKIATVGLALLLSLPVSASALTQPQVDSIIMLLKVFGVETSVLTKVTATLQATVPNTTLVNPNFSGTTGGSISIPTSTQSQSTVSQTQTPQTVVEAPKPVSTNKMWWATGTCDTSWCDITIGYTDKEGKAIWGVPLTVESTGDGRFVNYQDSTNLVSASANKLVTKTKSTDAPNPYRGSAVTTGITVSYVIDRLPKPVFKVSSPDGLSLTIDFNNL